MSKGLKEAKATDMFNRAASGLGSSFYGTKEKKQKPETQAQPNVQPKAQPKAQPEPTEAPADFKPQKGITVQIKNQKGTPVRYRFAGKKPLKWISPKNEPVTDKLLLKQLNLEAYKQQLKQQPQQQVPSTKNNQIDYISLYNSIDENEKNLNNISEIKTFIRKIKEFFEKNFNFFDNHQNLLTKYYEKEKQFKNLDRTRSNSVIYYYVLLIFLIEFCRFNNADKAYSIAINQLDITYNIFSYQQNYDSNHKEINNLIFENYKILLFYIEKKAKEQSNNNPINESLIRRWKVLANIK
jgi:hypothetical protein